MRSTVPDPDSSWRPSTQQERDAPEGYRALDEAEQDLHDRVRDALLAGGIDTSLVAIEVERDRVTLRGSISAGGALSHVENLVASVHGVGEVVDWLVIEPE